MRKIIVLTLLFSFLISSTGFCAVTIIKSAHHDGYTAVIPIYSDGIFNAYAAADDFDICFQSYAFDGRFHMRMVYECQNEKCKNFLVQSYSDGIRSGDIYRWSDIDPKFVAHWYADTTFDLPNGKMIVHNESYLDKWGYLMGSVETNSTEVLDASEPFEFEIAKRIDKMLAEKLQEALENPHSCINMIIREKQRKEKAENQTPKN